MLIIAARADMGQAGAQMPLSMRPFSRFLRMK